MSGRQVYLGNVFSSLAWMAAWALIILAMVFNSSRLAWPGMGMLAVAAVATMRACLAQHDRHTQRAFALQREVVEHPPSNVQRMR